VLEDPASTTSHPARGPRRRRLRWVVGPGLAVALAGGGARAAEGLWLPEQLPQFAAELKRLGAELDPRSLARLTEHPLHAVIDLQGCSASFVSPRGLVITNYHCAQSALQYNSTAERNLLDRGFLAGDLQQELGATPGSRVKVTVEVRDVTTKVTHGLEATASGTERHERIEAREKELIAECEQAPGYRCAVRSFHGGLQFRLYKQIEIRDVRLVYAPAAGIGAFGGEVDNWMWPRHTGDFAFLRAYVGPDGRPADPSAANVPYRPKHWLRPARQGIRETDLVLVAGYPGRTNRYRLAEEARNAFEWSYPATKKLTDEALRIIEAEAARRPEVEIVYAATIAGLNNATKNYQGMLDGYARSDMVRRKRALESRLQQWIAASDAHGGRHGSTLARLESLVARDQATQERDLVLEMLGRSSMLSTARQLYRLSREREKPDAEREPGYQERDATPFRERLERLERRYDAVVDQALWRARLATYLELPPEQRVAELDRFLGLDAPAGLDDRLSEMYRQTRLDETEIRLALMRADRAALEASSDPFVALAVALYDGDRAREREAEALAGEFQLERSRHMETLIAFLGSEGRRVYPDANGTLRVTYGQVAGYEPRDGVRYLPFTRLEGIAAKQTGTQPFAAPAILLQRIEARDHGPYRLDSLDSVPVDFLSTVDTTGGNSGSPTLNGRGELVGLLFDGTYDGINADWDFEERTTRAIHVDIRYVLWVMDKVDNARRVLEELGF